MSVAEQVSLCLAWSEIPEDTFSHGVAYVKFIRLALLFCLCRVSLRVDGYQATLECPVEFNTRTL